MYLNGISDVAENGSNPQQHGKPREQVFAKLDPFRSSLRRCQCVHTIFFRVLFSLLSCQTFFQIRVETVDQSLFGNYVDVQFKLLLEIVHFLCSRPRKSLTLSLRDLNEIHLPPFFFPSFPMAKLMRKMRKIQNDFFFSWNIEEECKMEASTKTSFSWAASPPGQALF